MNAFFKLGIMACCFLLLEARSFAGDLSLVVAPDVIVDDVPIKAVCGDTFENLTGVKIKISIESGSLPGLARSVRGETSSDEIYLPRLANGRPTDEGTVRLTARNRKCIFRIFVPEIEAFNYAVQRPEMYGNDMRGLGSYWFVWERPASNPGADELKTKDLGFSTLQTLATESSDFGSDSNTFDQEDGGNTILTRGVCIRPWDPTQWTRWGSGIVKWSYRNPRADGYSIKDENIDKRQTSSLRCPSGPNTTDYYIDGVYKRTWSYFAYKVPNHCTATQVIINGKRAFNCCCNVVGQALDGICRYIDTRPFGNWPIAGRSCK